MHPVELRAKRQQAFEAAALDVSNSEFDMYGMPSSTRSSSALGKRGSAASSSTGLFSRLRGKSSNTNSGHDFDEDAGDYAHEMKYSDPSNFPDISIKDLSSIRDRHRYPTFEDNASRVSVDSQSDVGSVYHAPQDSTPIIPTFGSTPTGSKSKHQNMQYRQKLVESRRQLLSNELYGGMPPPHINKGAPRTQTMTSMRSNGDAGYPRTMSLGGVPNGPPNGPPMGPPNGYPMGHPMGPPMGPMGGPMGQRRGSQISHGPHSQYGPPHGYLPQGPPQGHAPPQGFAPPRSMSRMSSNNDMHSPLSRELMPEYGASQQHVQTLEAANKQLEDEVRLLTAQLADHSQQQPSSQRVEQLEATNQSLEEELRVMSSQLASYSQQPRTAPERLENLESANRDLEDQVRILTAQLTGYNQQSQEKISNLETANSQLEEELKTLHAQLAGHERTTGSASSDRVEQLEVTNSLLEDEIKVLTVELAESARRELGLEPQSDQAVTAQELAKLQDMLLIERKRNDTTSRSRYSTTEAFTQLEHKHEEATQLLQVRSQELEQLRERNKQLVSDLEAADAKSSQLTGQVRELQVAKEQVERSKNLSNEMEEMNAENERLREMLNKHASSGSEEKLRMADQQREALQEALRSLRERKDQEISVLNARMEKLEDRLARLGPSSTRSFSLEEYHASADSSSLSLPLQRRQLSINTKFANDSGDFEVPRVRGDNIRPASPLHINFGISEPYAPPARAVSRTSTLPLALSGSS